MIYHNEIRNKNSNEWVIFLHGLCGNSAMWNSQVFAFKEKYNLCFIDLPSHGRSENAIVECRINSLEDIATAIIRILDGLNIKKAHFAGVSLGTLVIGKIYELYPERVSSVVMCGAVATFGMIQDFVMNIFGLTSKLCSARTLAQIWINYVLNKDERKNLKSLFIEQSKKISRPDTKKWIQMIIKEHKCLFNLDYSNLNILFVMGDGDKLFLTPVRKIKEKFNNIKLEILPNSGHLCNAHKPDNFNEISLNFLANA